MSPNSIDLCLLEKLQYLKCKSKFLKWQQILRYIIFISLTIIQNDENVTKISLIKTWLKCSYISLNKQKQDKVV